MIRQRAGGFDLAPYRPRARQRQGEAWRDPQVGADGEGRVTSATRQQHPRRLLLAEPGHRLLRRQPRPALAPGAAWARQRQRLEGNKRQRDIKATRAGSLVLLQMGLLVGFSYLLVKKSIFLFLSLLPRSCMSRGWIAETVRLPVLLHEWTLHSQMV